MSYSFKRVSSKRYKDLISIFKSAFNINVKESIIASKFNTPTGKRKDLGYIAYSEKNEASGFYGVYPCKVIIDKEVVMISQSGDTMVHNSHVRKGLFIRLANKTYELCKTEDIVGVFGFPSASSYYGFVNKLDWVHNDNIKKYIFNIFTFPLSEICYRIKVLSPFFKLWKNFILSFYEKGGYFSGNIIEDEQDGIYRDVEYWNYKLKNKLINVICIHGCDVIIKFEGKLGIGDINYKDPVDLKKVIKSLKFFCFILGINRFSFYISPNTKLEKNLSEIKKAKEGLPIGFLSFSHKYNLEKLKFCYFDMDTY